MIKTVVFDMFETLVSHYYNPLYFGAQMAEDANIAVDKFQSTWQLSDKDRTIGKMKLEQALANILKENNCYSEELLNKIVNKRIDTKKQCFENINPEIIPLFQALKAKAISIALISNCFSEEVAVIKNSILYPYFDAAYLSYEQGVAKPDEEIFTRCIKHFNCQPEECLYVGDGGSYELETAKKLGMKAIQATWYLRKDSSQPSQRKAEFIEAENPLKILQYL